MLDVVGKYNSCKIFTDNVNSETISQLLTLMDQEFVKGANIRVMPDCHAGKGCVIGFTANLGEFVVPNLVGVDIGCSMLTVNLGKEKIDLERIDDVIHRYIPSGSSTHNNAVAHFPEIQELKCYHNLKDLVRLENSLGTLGGGNHMIELDTDIEGNIYLVIHTGSRNLGKQVAEHYQDIAINLSRGQDKYLEEKNHIITEYKEQGREKEIQLALEVFYRDYKEKNSDVPDDLAYLYGEHRDDYLHDMAIVQRYSTLNRETIAEIILSKYAGIHLSDLEHFQTMHNYIGDDGFIRKGAISAYDNEKVLIPLNMRDGCIIAYGKGNEDYNFSAPHGAGRVLSRGEARRSLSMKDYRDSMKGIYSTCVEESTIDESPMAYKPMEDIIENIKDTVEIDKIIKPIYNFKSTENLRNGAKDGN